MVWPKLVSEDRGRTKRSYNRKLSSSSRSKGSADAAVGSEWSGKNVENPLGKQEAHRRTDFARHRTTSTRAWKSDDYYLYSINAFDNEILLNLSRFTASHGLSLAPNFVVQHYNSHNFTWFEAERHQHIFNTSTQPTPRESDSDENKTDSVSNLRSPIDRCLYIGRVVVDSSDNSTKNRQNDRDANGNGGTLLNLCHGMVRKC